MTWLRFALARWDTIGPMRWVVVVMLVAGCDRMFGLSTVATVSDPDAVVRCCAPSPLCPRVVDNASCVAVGCEWGMANACAGTHPSCDTYGAMPECERHDGCTWDLEGPCTGTHTACEKIDGAACGAHGCSSVPDSCGGSHRACGFYSGNPTLCQQHGCATDSDTGSCSGAPHACSSVAGEKCTEEAAEGCTLTAATCSGTPHACSLDTSGTTCAVGGCEWDAAECGGAPEECVSHGEATSCESHTGCAWLTDGSCVAPSDCADRSDDECTDGCSLQLCGS